MEDFEQQKKGIFDLVHSWDDRNIRLAALIWDANPALKEAVYEEFKEILLAKDYKSIAGLRVLASANNANINTYHDDDRVFYATKIRWLKISHVNLDLFPYLYLRNLENLKIASIMVEELPASIGHLKALTCLDLDGCRNLRFLPSEIKNLTYLETIKMRGTVLGDKYGVKELMGQQSIQEFFDEVLAAQK